MYLSAAIKILYKARSLSMDGINPVQSLKGTINNSINTSQGTTKLTNEYISSMTLHSGDMYGYITGGKGKYRAVDVWYSTGNDSSGAYKTQYLHTDGEAYRVYDSWIYDKGVALASWVQGNQTLFSFISAIVSTGGMAAYNGLKSGISSGNRVVHVSKSNPNSYAFSNGYGSNTGSTVSISVSLSDIEAYAMSLTKAQQAALGITVAATGVMSGGDGSQGSNNQGTPVKIEGRGSTGRTTPANVQEQMAMSNAKIDPLAQGKMIMDNMGDSRWSGWQKWQIVYKTTDSNITIHFVYDPSKGLYDDFKFVAP